MSRRAVLLVLTGLWAAFPSPDGARAERFSFVALGDTAYRTPEDYPAYRALIRRINAAKPAFSIHVGDTWGLEVCNEEEHERIRGFFQEYDHPVIYTPGDNEWVDCVKPELVPGVRRAFTGELTDADRAALGPTRTLEGRFERRISADPGPGLAALRKVFFSAPRSLGQKTLALERQADVSDFDELVENALWEHGGVVFGTVHVAGSRNNFFIDSEERALEAIARNRANLAWIRHVFARAKASDAKAAVIALHASLFEEGSGGDFSGRAIRDGEEGPFYWIAWAIRDLAEGFGRPTLLVHGDFHSFTVDRPFLVSTGEVTAPRFANVTRLQVYGAPDIKAVRVSVDTATPWVFGFSPLHD